MSRRIIYISIFILLIMTGSIFMFPDDLNNSYTHLFVTVYMLMMVLLFVTIVISFFLKLKGIDKDEKKARFKTFLKVSAISILMSSLFTLFKNDIDFMDMKYLLPAFGVSFGVSFLDLVFNKERKENKFDVNS